METNSFPFHFQQLLVANRRTFPIMAFQEIKSLAPGLGPPPQPLGLDGWAAGHILHRQMIGQQRTAGILPVFHLNNHRAAFTPGWNFLPPAPLFPSVPQAELKGIGKKGQRVKHRGLAAAVRPQQRRQGCQVLELHRPQRPKVFHFQGNQAGLWSGFSIRKVHTYRRDARLKQGYHNRRGRHNCISLPPQCSALLSADRRLSAPLPG